MRHVRGDARGRGSRARRVPDHDADPVDPSTGLPVARRRRRSIRIQDGYRRQANGGLARVFRLIDQVNGRYRETVRRDGVTVRNVDEPLREHRGHGSAKHGARSDPRRPDA